MIASTAALATWWAATLGHVALTGRWVHRAGWGGTTRDEAFFVWAVVALGSLSAVLHVVATTVGLGLGSVVVVLAAGHAIAAWRLRDRAPATVTPEGSVVAALELAAATMLAGVVGSWIAVAIPTIDVSGTDAAHYHVPNAVNLALGASPFDLPPTSHLYPMGTSLLAAWAIVPTSDALLVDLATLLPFLLSVAAANWLFRLVTAQSGLAWMTWPMLALYGTRLFRDAALMSADLLFTAATMGLAAWAIQILISREVRGRDLVVGGLTIGLLLGAKTTGLVAAALIGAPATLAAGVLFFAGRRRSSGHAAHLAGALAAVVAAGGVWLVRNWWVWGSPVVPNGLSILGIQIFPGVPYEPTTYLSVLGDLTNDPAYALGDRVRHYAADWLGAWYLSLLLLAVLVPLDAAVSAFRRDWRAAGRRALLVAIVFGTFVPMAWLLIGAPWTSLEWTRGMALRYAQPWWALAVVVAAAGLFPASWPWYRRSAPALAAGVLAAIAGIAGLSMGDLPYPPVPAFLWIVTAAMFFVRRRAATAPIPTPVLAAGLATLAVTIGYWSAISDGPARDRVIAATGAATPSQARAVFELVRASEAQAGRECDARRFFVTTRFDEPLGLQGVVYQNLVFYAARDVAVTSRVRPPLGECDYVITARDVMSTEKGQQLVAGLNPFGTTEEVGEVGRFLVLKKR